MANLFTIRPVGVESKKLIGTRRILLRSCSCRSREARIVPKEARAVETSRKIPRRNTSTVQTLMQVGIIDKVL